MKRRIVKAFILLLITATLTAAFTLSTSAEDTTLDDIKFISTDSEGTLAAFDATTFAEAVEKTPDGGTLYFLDSYTVDARSPKEGELLGSGGHVVDIDKSITIDLTNTLVGDGTSQFMLSIIQNGAQSINVTNPDAEIVIKGGQLNVIDVADYGIAGYAASPLFVGEGMNITIDSTYTYLSSLVYSTGGDASIKIIGGEHHINFTPVNTYTDSAWIECLGNADVDFLPGTENPTGESSDDYAFVLSYFDTSIASFMGGEDTVATVNSNFSLFAAIEIETNLVSNAHAKTSLYFETTALHMSLKPDKGAFDGSFAATLGPNFFFCQMVDYSIIDPENPEMSLLMQLMQYIDLDAMVIADNAYIFATGETVATLNRTIKLLMSGDPITNGFATGSAELSLSSNLALLGAVTVEVYDSEGELYETIYASPGEIVSPTLPIDYNERSNGYIAWKNTGAWYDGDGNYLGNTIVASGNVMRVYPEFTVRPHLSAAQYNLSLFTHFEINLMIPEDMPDNVEIIEVAGLNSPTRDIYDADGNKYHGYKIATASPHTFGDEYTTTVTMKVTSNSLPGGETYLTQTVSKLCALTYTKGILADSEKSVSEQIYSGEAHRMMADLVRYCYTAINIKIPNHVLYYEYLDCLRKYEHLLTDLGDDFLNTVLFEQAEDDTLEDTLADYVSFITYNYYLDSPMILFNFRPRYLETHEMANKAIEITEVRIVIEDGWIPGEFKDEGVGYNWGQTVYTQDDSWIVNRWDENTHITELVLCEDGHWRRGTFYGTPYEENGITFDELVCEHIATVMIGNIPFYNVDKELTLVLTLGDGSTVSGTYSMASYYAAMKTTYDELIANGEIESGGGFPELEYVRMEDIANYVYATYACSRSIASYRFSTAIDADGNTVNY